MHQIIVAYTHARTDLYDLSVTSHAKHQFRYAYHPPFALDLIASHFFQTIQKTKASAKLVGID